MAAFTGERGLTRRVRDVSAPSLRRSSPLRPPRSAPAAAQTPIMPILDHIHLNVPDQAKARRVVPEELRRHDDDRGARSADVRRHAADLPKNDKGQPSAGSAIDHIGFSVADLDAKMKEFEAAGMKIVTPVRDVPGPLQARVHRGSVGHAHRSRAGSGEARAASRPPARARSGRDARVVLGQVRRREGEAEGSARRPEAAAACGCSCSAATRCRATGTRSITSAGARRPRRQDRRAEGAGVKFTTEPRPLKLASGAIVNFAYVEGRRARRSSSCSGKQGRLTLL